MLRFEIPIKHLSVLISGKIMFGNFYYRKTLLISIMGHFISRTARKCRRNLLSPLHCRCRGSDSCHLHTALLHASAHLPVLLSTFLLRSRASGFCHLCVSSELLYCGLSSREAEVKPAEQAPTSLVAGSLEIHVSIGFFEVT